MATGSGTGTPASTPATTPATLARLINIYAGLTEIKTAADMTGTAYDAVLLRMASHASRLIDAATGLHFYPELATRYLDGNGATRLWLSDPALAITTLQLSSDNGYSYTETLTENTDFWCSDGAQYGRSPTQLLVMSPNGSYSVFYNSLRAVKVTGLWGYHRNYAAAWEDSQDTVQAEVSPSTTSITVGNADGSNQLGLAYRFEIGQLLRIDSEYLAVTAINTSTNALTVVRACNGTTAATHAASTRVDIWRPDDLVRLATLIQATRWFKRAQSAFQDVAAAAELGQLTFARKIDPEVEFLLIDAGLRRLTVG